MAAKAWASQPKTLDELFFQNDSVSLCLLINRRARTMRVIDFRAGATPAKRMCVQSLAQREEVDKVYTLVERDEVQTWMKLGFAKEGTIPGFYKRSDAFVMGASVPSPTAKDLRTRAANNANYTAGTGNGKSANGYDIPLESETRLVAAPAVGSGLGLSVRATAAVASPALDRMERTIAAGKRASKDLSDRPLSAKITEISESDARKAVSAALRAGRALSEFEPFGRDVQRRYFLATTRGGYELCVSTESQICFSNAFLEVLNSPRTDAEKQGAAAAIAAVGDKLTAEGVVSCFALAPSDDVPLATAFLHAGFRRTGLLLGHWPGPANAPHGPQGATSTRHDGRMGRVDVILWSRKLANPTGE
ncbi:MAG TPA: hypothetical protein VK841_15600 [Polyangiaceae bacterium]|jgi:hypothetical protein|nr:hypothetical protein [Polyangiaceae bacterium]